MSNRTELRLIASFMLVNADFFAAPLLNSKEFSSWARKQPEMFRFSKELHLALNTSQPDDTLLKKYREAIVGKPVHGTINFSKRNCLLSGDVKLMISLLHINSNLVKIIKKYMSSDLFDNWYVSQTPQIQKNKIALSEQIKKVVKRIDHDIENYQTKKLKSIRSSCLAKEISLQYEYQGHALSFYKNHQKPTRITIKTNGKTDADVSKLQLLADKYNIAQDLRETLRKPKTNVLMNLINFSKQIQEKDIIHKLTANNDSDGVKLLKTTAYALATLLFGLGICLSYKNKGTWKFWQSTEESLLDSTRERINACLN